MLQSCRFKKGAKGHIRGDCRRVCDINRALLEARDPEAMLAILLHVLGRRDVEILWWKDRPNEPTDGGWIDVLILFRINGTNGHVDEEVQVAFRSMVASRKAGEGHAAYADSRDSIETIEAAGGDFVMGDVTSQTQNKKLRDDNAALRHDNGEQLALLRAKDADVADLKKKNAMLEQHVALLTKSTRLQPQRQQRRPEPATGPQPGASWRRPPPTAKLAQPTAAAAEARRQPAQPGAALAPPPPEVWDSEDRDADPDQLRRQPRGRFCGYTAPDGRSCKAQALGDAAQCHSHTSQANGCRAPKSSWVAYCPEHDDSSA